MIAHGEEPDKANEKEGDKRGDGGMHSNGHQQPIEDSSGYAGHGIYLFLEDERLLVEKDVADDATCGSRDAAHDNGHPDGMSAIESLLKAGDGEEGEAKRIEHEPGVVEALERTGEDNDEDLGQGRADQIERRCHPERRHAKHEVADGTATNGHGHTTDKAAKPIEMLGGSMAYARYGEGESSYEFYDLQKNLHWMLDNG